MMRMMRTLLRRIFPLLIFVAAIAPALRAQGDAMLTNFTMVPVYYNPAAAGDTDNIRIRGGARLQWVGIHGAPQTFLAAADTPFKFLGKRWGAGITVQQESMGLFRNLTADLEFGYRFKALRGQWSAAVQIGFFNEQFKGSDVYIPDDDDYHQSADDAIPQRDLAGNALDLGIGVYYVHPRFKAGISLLHANSPTVTFTDDSQNASSSAGSSSDLNKKYKFTAPRALYFTAEGNIPLRNTLFEVLPAVLLRSDFSSVDVAANVRLRYNKLFYAGVGYRHTDAVSLLLGAEIKGIFLAYAYDWSFSAISRASSGSHEIFAGYNLKLDFSEKNRNKHKSIRIM